VCTGCYAPEYVLFFDLNWKLGFRGKHKVIEATQGVMLPLFSVESSSLRLENLEIMKKNHIRQI
jgi:hypothetical protein